MFSTGSTGSTANFFSKPHRLSFSEGQPGFPCPFGKRPDSAMILVPISIKANALDADAKGLLCNRFAHNFSGLFVAGFG
jgi:hypothetical protein